MSLETSPGGDLEAQLRDFILEVDILYGLNREGDAARLEELSSQAAAIFVGLTVSATKTPDGVNKPITAYYNGHERLGWAGINDERTVRERPESGMMVPHPERATGTIQELRLAESAILLRPRLWSPYRTHKGFFKVELTYQCEPAVKLKFGRQKKS